MNSKKTTPLCQPKKYFRMLVPKSSNVSSPLLKKFESSLVERLKKLIPQNKDEILNISWMILAMESLYETNNDINILITDLKLHDMTDSEHRCWVDVYMDMTVKLLDLCNAFSSLVGGMKHCNFCLKILRHKLEMKYEEQCIEIRSTLDSWRKNINVENPQCLTVLGRFVESLKFPKVNNFIKAKAFLKAFYAANVITAYICNLFAIAFSNCDSKMLPIYVSKQSLWKKDFLKLQTIVRDLLSSNGTMVLKELKYVDAKVKKMYVTIQDGDDFVEESFKESIGDLKEEVEKLDHGFDELSRKIDNLFNITLQGRGTICEDFLYSK